MKEFPDSIISPIEIKNSGLYSFRTTNFHKDWETGYIDDYDLEFFEVKE